MDKEKIIEMAGKAKDATMKFVDEHIDLLLAIEGMAITAMFGVMAGEAKACRAFAHNEQRIRYAKACNQSKIYVHMEENPK